MASVSVLLWHMVWWTVANIRLSIDSRRARRFADSAWQVLWVSWAIPLLTHQWLPKEEKDNVQAWITDQCRGFQNGSRHSHGCDLDARISIDSLSACGFCMVGVTTKLCHWLSLTYLSLPKQNNKVRAWMMDQYYHRTDHRSWHSHDRDLPS